MEFRVAAQLKDCLLDRNHGYTPTSPNTGFNLLVDRSHRGISIEKGRITSARYARTLAHGTPASPIQRASTIFPRIDPPANSAAQITCGLMSSIPFKNAASAAPRLLMIAQIANPQSIVGGPAYGIPV